MNMLLNIIFQSGDFYNEGNSFWGDFFINVVGALIGTLTALLVFYLTLKHDKKKGRTQENKQIGQRLHYFASMVSSINKTVKQQCEHIKTFYERQQSDTLNIPLITMLPANDLKRFSEMQNHEDYYHAYLSKFGYTSETVTEFRSYYSLIDYLKFQMEQANDILAKSIQYDYDKKIKYQTIVEKGMDDAVDIFNKAKVTGQIDDFANFLNETLLHFYEGEVDCSDLNEFQSKIVNPIKMGIIKHFRNLDVAMNMATEFKKATYIFTQINISNNRIAEDFEAIYKQYKDASDKLNSLTEKLNSKFQ